METRGKKEKKVIRRRQPREDSLFHVLLPRLCFEEIKPAHFDMAKTYLAPFLIKKFAELTFTPRRVSKARVSRAKIVHPNSLSFS
jgi:hypothetical protein